MFTVSPLVMGLMISLIYLVLVCFSILIVVLVPAVGNKTGIFSLATLFILTNSKNIVDVLRCHSDVLFCDDHSAFFMNMTDFKFFFLFRIYQTHTHSTTFIARAIFPLFDQNYKTLFLILLKVSFFMNIK